MLAAGVMGALALALSMRVHSTLKDVGRTEADIRVKVEATREQDLDQPFFYDLLLFDERTKQQEGVLPGPDTLLELTDLRPGTEYELIYYVTDENGRRTEVGRFRFRTLGRGKSGQSGTGSGGGTGGGVSTPTPVVIDVSPSPSPSQSPAQLAILTDSLADATELSTYSAAIEILNTTGQAPSFTISGYPSGMGATGDTLHGEPALETHGSHSIQVTVTAGGLSASKTLTLYVNPVVLEITNANLGTFYRGETVSGTVRTSFTPPSGLTYGASCPLGGSCNATTGAFSIPIPDDAEFGEYSIALSAAGGGYSAAKTITFRVVSRPRPAPPVPESNDLVIDYFVAINDTSISETSLSLLMDFCITKNKAENVRITISSPMGTPIPSAPNPELNANGQYLDGSSLNTMLPVEHGLSSTVTMTVKYDLGGAEKTKTATISLITTYVGISTGGESILLFPVPPGAEGRYVFDAGYVTDGPFEGFSEGAFSVDTNYFDATVSTSGGIVTVDTVSNRPASTAATGDVILTYDALRLTYSHPGPTGVSVIQGDKICTVPILNRGT